MPQVCLASRESSMQERRQSGGLVRRCVTAAVTAALLASPVGTVGAAEQHAPSAGRQTATVPLGDFVSRPDLDAPELTTTTTGEEASGLLLTTPGLANGMEFQAAIYDNEGEPVWLGEPEADRFYFDLEAVTFQGRPALAVFSGVQTALGDLSHSECLILDASYRQIAAFQLSGYPTDAHDVAFSPDGSRVLLMSHHPVSHDMSPYGGPADATVIDTVVQERDITTGEVTFEWSALDRVPVTESTVALESPDPTTGVYPLYHVNSLDYDTDGDLLVSGRNTDTVYKIDHATGDIVWRFGGSDSDFTFADPADAPRGQHDVRRLPDGRLSMFDNGTHRLPEEYSRGAVYELDERAMTAELVADLRPETAVFSPIVGSNRLLPEGHQLVSFGSTGQLVEFDGDQPVFTATLEAGHMTYRTERADWHATPDAPPDVVLGEPAEDGRQTLYISWNGATDVALWRVEAGPAEDDLATVATTPRTGFETTADITPPANADVYRITALGPFGAPLGSSTLTPTTPTTPTTQPPTHVEGS